MRRFALAVLAVLPLAACDDPGSRVPVDARLSGEELTVSMSDGARCVAQWRGTPEGVMANCPELRYRVAVVENPNLLRQLMDGIAGALEAEGVLAPMAEVTVFSGTRRWRFVSPPPAE